MILTVLFLIACFTLALSIIYTAAKLTEAIINRCGTTLLAETIGVSVSFVYIMAYLFVM